MKITLKNLLFLFGAILAYDLFAVQYNILEAQKQIASIQPGTITQSANGTATATAPTGPAYIAKRLPTFTQFFNLLYL